MYAFNLMIMCSDKVEEDAELALKVLFLEAFMCFMYKMFSSFLLLL